MVGDKKLKILSDLVGEGGKIADNLTTTDAEQAAELTKRQVNDLTSPFKLPHLIRPIAFIWAMALQTVLSTIVVILAFKVTPVDSTSIMVVIGSNSAILATIVGFYFQSRKNEKIAFKNAEANIALREMELEAELEEKEMLLDEEVKDKRVERRNNKKGLFNRN